MNPTISIIAPLHNEEGNVWALYERIRNTCLQLSLNYELILVDDGSADNTLPIIEKIAASDNNVMYLSFTRNFGHQNALFAGIENAQGDYLVLIDGDLQDPPEKISDLWKEIGKGFDVVYAQRSARKGESVLKKISAAIFYRLLNRLTSITIPIDTGDFRIMKKEVAAQLLKMNDQSKFIRGQMAWLGFKESSILYEREQRSNGKSNFGYGSMLRFAWDGITSFSELPLKFASISGMLVSFASFIMIIYVLLAKYVWHETITGWTSLMVAILFLGGIQLLSIGIIGQYIGRINEQVRHRQHYVVRKSNIRNSLHRP